MKVYFEEKDMSIKEFFIEYCLGDSEDSKDETGFQIVEITEEV